MKDGVKECMYSQRVMDDGWKDWIEWMDGERNRTAQHSARGKQALSDENEQVDRQTGVMSGQG